MAFLTVINIEAFHSFIYIFLEEIMEVVFKCPTVSSSGFDLKMSCFEVSPKHGLEEGKYWIHTDLDGKCTFHNHF